MLVAAAVYLLLAALLRDGGEAPPLPEGSAGTANSRQTVIGPDSETSVVKLASVGGSYLALGTPGSGPDGRAFRRVLPRLRDLLSAEIGN